MSRVFVAEDKRLGRKVVVKTLPLEMAGAISLEIRRPSNGWSLVTAR